MEAMIKKHTVEVFKTSVTGVAASQQILRDLQAQMPAASINFDLEDCDRILRVEAVEVCVAAIIRTLNHHGYSCEVLA